jgi:hypothetical protein
MMKSLVAALNAAIRTNLRDGNGRSGDIPGERAFVGR